MSRLLLLLLLIISPAAAERLAAQQIVNPRTTYTYNQLLTDMISLENLFPEVIRTDVMGTTVEGRDIPYIELGRGNKKIFVCAAMHAREYFTTGFVMNFIDKAAAAYRDSVAFEGFNMRQILDSVTFCVMPMVNPDGVNISQNGLQATEHKDISTMQKNGGVSTYGYKSWKANIRGVDINRNFQPGWSNYKTGAKAPAACNFHGYTYESEPETKAIIACLQKISPLAVLSFHTQGHVLYATAPDARTREILRQVRRATGFMLRPTYDPYGSFQDYVDARLNILYMCVELCPSVGPFPYSEAKFDEEWRLAKTVLPIVATGFIKDPLLNTTATPKPSSSTPKTSTPSKTYTPAKRRKTKYRRRK